MKQYVLPFFLFLFCQIEIFAQQQPTPVFIGSDAPGWMTMMVSDSPNVRQIRDTYETWFKTRPFEKSTYTQYYKRWMHWARTYTQSDGYLHFPTPEELNDREKQLRSLRPMANGAEKTPSWSFVGPKQTFDTDGTTVVTWQTNIYSFDVSLSDPNTLYAGGETGGMWKTTDKGLNWTLLTTNLLHGSFGATRIHPTNPNIVYAGTGGKIIKTTDGGATWATVYAETNLWTNEIAISTADPNIVMAACDQGFLRSTNGGTTWSKLFTNQTWTVRHKPGDPNTVFLVRKSGSNCDFMVSSNGGTTFTTSNTGLWTPGTGESVTGALIAVCPSNPSTLYTYFCGSGSNLYGYVGVYKSTNSGASWVNTNPAGSIGNSPTPYTIPTHTNLMAHNGTTGFDQGFYDMAIVVNPSNASQLIAGGTSWFRSNDGGATWTALGSYVGGLPWSHPDIQCTVAVGNDLWISSDGGINYSSDWATNIEARMNGISGSDNWGFDSGWNEDILVGGRYHNGNMAYHESFPAGKFYRMGGAEAATGYVNPGPERKTYHSDIGGYVLNGGFGNGVTYFPVGQFPNESYAYYANSEMVWHPACWNIVFLGKDNILWKSTDGGTSFTAWSTFPGTATNTLYDIEIARANPQVMYVSQWDGTDDRIFKSVDGGVTFVACTPLPLPNNNDRIKMAVSAENTNVLWAAVTYGSNGKKIYKSTDGGVTWINLTTSVLNNLTVTNVMAQYGTDGGIYLGTDGGVFYRNNTLNNWQAYSAGLPLSAETNRLKPFYRDGKIRNGCWGFGVWEAPLYEPSAVIPQAMTDKLSSSCARDTFFFDDHSVVLHSGATWSWSFTGAQTVIGANTRTPKVIFGTPGTKTAIMTLTTPSGTYLDTLSLQVGNACDPDSLPGYALSLDGSGDYASTSPNLNLNSNTVTLMAWIKPVGTQNDWGGILFCRGGNTTAGVSIKSNNEIRYHWNDTNWSWSSGVIAPSGQWSHVALVISPNSATIYLNGVPTVHSTAHSPEEFDAPLQIGYDPNGGSRYFTGLIEEACVYNKSLTQNEIREIMHLCRTHTDTTGLKAYYQFNETSGLVLDRVGVRHASLVGDAYRPVSTCPVGPGYSARLTVSSGGAKVFPNTGLTLTFPPSGTYPNGELCATRINWVPDYLPTTAPLSPAYWVVHNYGSNATFSQLTSLEFAQIGNVPAGTSNPSDYTFYKRGSNADGNTWGGVVDFADQLTYGPNGAALFSNGNGVTSFSQFIVAKPIAALPVEWVDFQAKVEGPHLVQLVWSTASEKNTLYFTVERSADGLHFSGIGSVPAKGKSGLQNDYSFPDGDPLTGWSYYRIRTNDADGSTRYSEVRSVRIQGDTPLITVSPNPVSRNGICRIRTTVDGTWQFRLFDEKGRAVRIVRLSGQADVSMDGLPAGAYVYRIENENFMRFGKLIIE
jgi:photosystem II stability/assembly factor-like uncharacterized protein